MIRPENFIYFITACGFFIGLVFAVFSHTAPIDMVWSTLIITVLFYILALASSGFFIKYSQAKQSYSLRSDFYDIQLSKAINQIERRERFIRDSQSYIRELEAELYKEADQEVQRTSQNA